MKHTLSILVNNNPGVMSHVSGLFTRRSYNIDSIAVGVTSNVEISSMTIVVRGDEAMLAQVKKQLMKLPDVLSVEDLAYEESINRELVLISVSLNDSTRVEVISICEVFKAKIAELNLDSILVEFSGNTRQVSSFIQNMEKYGILEIARTGQIALKYRGKV
ncbi:MAG: acetolactate synthase small subunit [Leptospiraceae bacterium]|jgi:acetolactate synthase-1/3 small subunit|nr:acetolactate synthase small subunit [Leptospiraceae bacterium]MCZ8346876.1 acetolactate synthase small subunit [Leptospiraceae bacterium]PJE04480.1 MAG: acetolactate synthase small subunit [Leptospira sp.]